MFKINGGLFMEIAVVKSQRRECKAYGLEIYKSYENLISMGHFFSFPKMSSFKIKYLLLMLVT